MRNKKILKLVGNIIIILPIIILCIYHLPILGFTETSTNSLYEYELQVNNINNENKNTLNKKDYNLINIVNENKITGIIYNEVKYWNYTNPSDREAAYIASMIYITSHEYNVDPLLVTAIGTVESNLRMGPNKSHAGAIGMMQLMPNTADWLEVNPYNFEDNLEGGVKFLAHLLDKYNNNIKYAVAHYNGGTNPAYKMEHIPETKNYVWNVMNIYKNLNK